MQQQNEPTQEQVKEFWEWCGCQVILSAATARFTWHIIFPDNIWNKLDNLSEILDLNNLFKYAVSKLLKDGYNIEYYNFQPNEYLAYAEVNVWRKGATKHEFEVLHDEHIVKNFQQGDSLDNVTALALFWAIYSMIDKSPPPQKAREC